MIRASTGVKQLIVAASLALLSVWTTGAQAQVLLPGFSEQIVISGLTQPSVVQFASDGRVFVAEKSGLIKVFANLSATTPTIFADLRAMFMTLATAGFWDWRLIPSSHPYRTFMCFTPTTARSAGSRQHVHRLPTVHAFAARACRV